MAVDCYLEAALAAAGGGGSKEAGSQVGVVGFGAMYQGIEEHRGELAEICTRRGVRRLEILGSGATDRFDPASSDLDFLVEFAPAPPGETADRYFGLLEDLQALFGLPVDLVVARAIRNPYFREGIERSRTLLYAA